MTGEFELIRQVFQRRAHSRDDVSLGIGDDCALLQVPSGHELAVSMDTLVSGVHFFPDVDPYALGHKALAVNLSDLAAMGADPAWFTLALTLPDANDQWLHAFAEGLFDLANRYSVALVGGDTTKGPLSITIQVHGFVPNGQALTRSGAQVGDLIYVSGPLGDAGLGLALKLDQYADTQYETELVQALEFPQPRLEYAALLREYATACIDISDGLGSDLRHVLMASGVGGQLWMQQLPTSLAVQAYIEQTGDKLILLNSGDAYELCFTVAAAQQQDFDLRLKELGLIAYVIGKTVKQPGLSALDADGKEFTIEPQGYDHFGSTHE